MMYNNMFRIMFDKKVESEDDPLFVRLKALERREESFGSEF